MDELQISIADVQNRNEIRDFLMRHFLVEETMNVATKITEDEFSPFAEHTFDTALHTPFSIICRNGENGNIVGVALNTVRRRDDPPYKIPPGKPKRREIVTIDMICEEIHNGLWELIDPEINTILELDILNVAHSFQRRGIAGKMLDKRNSSELLEEYGIQGFICQASSYANQMLLTGRGYQEIKSIPFNQYTDDNGVPYIRPLDETKSVKLFWKPYNP
ncbi:hypothetical protein DICVIV_04975 [Dictyocaulus viviparus]|uniref:aralkylamine N-acetyltransferase n=1 Tax=Dictyocaulus viviparus TaxID=29172 RepID=A0A0D8XWL0_DICVI|nr:hypothetical protein DICVIV_04975 [Dictyocaulus viviparus]